MKSLKPVKGRSGKDRVLTDSLSFDGVARNQLETPVIDRPRKALPRPVVKDLTPWLLRRKDCAERWYLGREHRQESSASRKAIANEFEVVLNQHESALSLIPIYEAMFNDIGADWLCFQYMKRRIIAEGWHFISVKLPALEKALLSGLSSGVFTPIPDFFAPKGYVYPRFLRSLWSQVFFPDGILRPVGDSSPIACQQLRQILGFAYKSHVPCGYEKENAAVEQFSSTENELERFITSGSIDWTNDPILKVASLAARGLVSDYSPDTCIFKHGPGVTANIPIDQKYEAPLSDFPSVWKFGKTFFFNEEDQGRRIGRYKPWTHDSVFQQPTAVVKLVPKDARGPRIISAEPFENQWAQQGIRGYLYDKAERHWLTAGHVNFRNQEVNRGMARIASITRSWSTLDLKEASDRVSMPLVQALFGETRLYEDLVWTRSSATMLPNGRTLRLLKFAPMGSALCFPILALSIFFLLLAGLTGLGIPPEVAKDMIYVMGDDVIVPTEHAHFCIRVLERYGLLVNRNKSFIDSRFAESCGMDCFDGNDISIVRLKHCPTTSKIQCPETLVSLVETANLFDTMGYQQASEQLYMLSESQLGPLPYGYGHSSFLCRRMAAHRGNCAINASSLRGIKFKFRNLKNNTRKFVCKAPFVYDCSNLVADATFGGHMLRIQSLIGKEDTVLPDPGVFTERKRIAIKHAYVGDEDFYEVPANNWLPS